MSNAELDRTVRREQFGRGVLIPIAALLLFGWAVLNSGQKKPERLNTASLDGCYMSELGLGVVIDADRLRLLPGGGRSIAFAVTREKVGLTIVPEMTITVEADVEGPVFQITSLKDSRWIPNLTLRRFAPEARYTVIDIAKANGFTMLGHRDARAVDFYRDPSCGR